jgi:hypothetical protein
MYSVETEVAALDEFQRSAAEVIGVLHEIERSL